MLNKKRNFKGDNGPVVNGFFSEFPHCCFTCLLRVEWHNLGLFYDFFPRTHTQSEEQSDNRIIDE